MAPTSIDGTNISAATIDGTEVQEITVDGQVVYTATTSTTEGWGNLTAWNEVQNGISLNSSNSVSGDAAYMGNDDRGGPHSNSNDSGDGGVLSQSETDSPTEATVDTTTYVSSHSTDNNTGGIKFRWNGQGDHYVAGMSTNRNEFWVVKHVNGNRSSVNTVGTNSGLSNGTFFEHRVEMVESGNDLQFTLYIDNNQEAQITDTNPDHTGGGGVGIGMEPYDGDAANNNSAYTGWWTDNTTITY